MQWVSDERANRFAFGKYPGNSGDVLLLALDLLEARAKIAELEKRNGETGALLRRAFINMDNGRTSEAIIDWLATNAPEETTADLPSSAGSIEQP
jgi:hypothetical protein